MSLAQILLNPAMGGGPRVFVSSVASGDNDGSSWANAYTDLQNGIDALVDGGTLLIDAPQATPFIGGYTISGLQGFRVITNQGPSGESWFTDGRSASWTDAGGGLFTLALAQKPTHVAYDFKQDDLDGTITGADLNDSRFVDVIAAAESNTQWTKDEMALWYGFLTENTSTPTTPGDGEWGHSGGTLYINPPGTPDLATVNSLARYVVGGVNALTCNGCSNFAVSGRMIGFMYPDDTSNTGYILKGHSVTNARLSGVLSIASGYHAVGIAGSSGGGGTISDCLSVGLESAIPYVFYTDSDLPNAGHVGSGLVTVCSPLLAHDGDSLSSTGYSPNPCYSHSAGGSDVLGGIDWHHNYMVDVSAMLRDKNGNTMPTPGQTSLNGLVTAGNVPTIADHRTESDFSIVCRDSIAVGVNAMPMPQVAYKNCTLDRTGFGDNTLPAMAASTGGAVLKWFTKDCTIKTGDYSQRYIGAVEDTDGVHFEGNVVTIQSTEATGKSGVFSPSGTLTNPVISMVDNQFTMGAGATGVDCVVRLGSPDMWPGPYDFIESSNNEFEIVSSFRHSNTTSVAPKDTAWWAANVSATDTFV